MRGMCRYIAMPHFSKLVLLALCNLVLIACSGSDDSSGVSGNSGASGSSGSSGMAASAGSSGAGSGGSSGSAGTAGASGSAGMGGSAGAGATAGSAGTGGTGATGGAAGSGSTCDFDGYDVVAQDALVDAQGNIKYLAQNTLGAPVDVLTFELVAPSGGVQPGMYPITDENYATCTRCITLYQGCDAQLANCAKAFLAVAGSLEISEVGASGATFSGSLSSAKLVEVTIAGDLTSTKVDGGATYCLDQFLFSTTLQ